MVLVENYKTDRLITSKETPIFLEIEGKGSVQTYWSHAFRHQPKLHELRLSA